MKILGAIVNFLRGKDREFAAAIDEPVNKSRLAIDDSKALIEKYTLKIAELIAETKKRMRQRDEAKAKVAEWESIANTAAAKGDEESVRVAVQQKQMAAAQIATLEQEIASDQALEAQLRSQLEKARAKVAQAESDFTRLAARQQGAKIREQLARSAADINGGPLAALDDLKETVENQELKAEALEEITVDTATTAAQSVKEKYASAGNSNVDDEVARLMAGANAAK